MSDLEQRLAKLQTQFANLRIIGGEGVSVAGGMGFGGYTVETKGGTTDSGGTGTMTPTGACCAEDNSCTVGTEADCVGVYQGDNTVCDPNPCLTCPPDETTIFATISGISFDCGCVNDSTAADGNLNGATITLTNSSPGQWDYTSIGGETFVTLTDWDFGTGCTTGASPTDHDISVSVNCDGGFWYGAITVRDFYLFFSSQDTPSTSLVIDHDAPCGFLEGSITLIAEGGIITLSM